MRKLGYALKRHIRRRSAIKPEIEHMKSDGLLSRNFFKGMQGDDINAIPCEAGHSLRKILTRLRALLYLFTMAVRAIVSDVIGRLEALITRSIPYKGLEDLHWVLQGRLDSYVVLERADYRYRRLSPILGTSTQYGHS